MFFTSDNEPWPPRGNQDGCLDGGRRGEGVSPKSLRMHHRADFCLQHVAFREGIDRKPSWMALPVTQQP